MTLQQAINIVKRLSHRGDINVTNDEDTSLILDSINLARRDILLELPKRYLRITGTISVVAGTTNYSLGATVQKAMLFRYTVNNTEYFLKKVETEQEFYRLVYSASTNRRRPLWYFESGVDSGGQQIIVYPIPDASYTVTFSYQKSWDADILTTSDLSSQIPEIPLWTHNQVVMGGVFYTMAAYDDPKTNDWERRYLGAVAKANYYEENDEDSLWNFRLRPEKIETGI